MADNKDFNFTKATLEALATPPTLQYYFDTAQRNLCLAVSPKGLKVFYIWRKVKGRKVRFKIGRFPELSVGEARTLCGDYLNRIEKGEDVEKARREAREELTLKEFFKVYLERHAKPHKKSWAFDAANFANHLEKPLGSLPLSEIRQSKVIKLHSHIGTERGPIIANRVLNLLTLLFNKAAEWGHYPRGAENPTRFVKRFKETSRDRFLQGDELPHFFAALQAETNQTIRDYIWVSLFTGARKANVLAMTWHQVDLVRKEWHIPETKNGEALILPLVDEVVKVLQKRRRSTSSVFVFPGEGKTGHLQDPKAAWKRLLQAACVIAWEANAEWATFVKGVRSKNKDATPTHLYHLLKAEAQSRLLNLPEGMQDLHLHDLRRTLGSWQTIAGASPFIVGRSLGHKDLKSTAIYARLNLDPIRASLTQAVQLMSDIGEGKTNA